MRKSALALAVLFFAASAAAQTKPKPAPKPAPKNPPGVADPAVRQKVAGGPTAADATTGVESPELKALREAERELFPPAMPQGVWPAELPSPLAREDGLVVHTSGLPPPSVPSSVPTAEGGKDLKWLTGLKMPDLPVRWEPRLVRYLEIYKEEGRAHAAMGYWLKKSGRYRDLVRKTLRSKNVPEDLLWLAMIESGFEPTARSPVGALGMWQFMGETGKQYGLPQDRWVDHRMNVVAETSAAADFLSDLHRRFGSWELAMAAYNMGYGGLSVLVRRYNTNDYWALSRLEGSLPWETTLYVPKIIAAAIVAHNPSVFGFQDLVLDPPLDYEEVMVAPGVALSTVAQAGGIDRKELESLNPELRASRTPVGEDKQYPLKVPAGKGNAVTAGLAKMKSTEPAFEKYVVRFGESLQQIAQARGTTTSKLVDWNAIGEGEVIRGGMVLLVPPLKTTSTSTSTSTSSSSTLPNAIVPAELFVYPNRKRIFYRVAPGDVLPDIASTLGVTGDDLRRWNDIDPAARLIEGMTLQAFVPEGTDLSKVVVLAENEVRVVPVGSDDFFALSDSMKGKKRIAVTAKAGETLESIGKRFGVSTTSMERINRRDRREAIKAGETIVVYTPMAGPAVPAPVATDTLVPDPLPPLPDH